jgi:hypothetical protein
MILAIHSNQTDEVVTTSGMIHFAAAFPFFLLSMIAMLVISVRMWRADLQLAK